MTEPTPYTTPATASRKWNPLAIVSFVTSLVGASIVGVIAGHVALRQIAARAHTAPEIGRPLAITGLVLGYVTIAVVLVLVTGWLYSLSTGNLVLGR